MKNVVLVAPYFGGNMLHCMRCFANLDIRLGLVTQEPEERIPADLRPRITGHYRIGSAGDAGQLAAAVAAFQKEWGTVDRLEGYLEQLQVPIAEARDLRGIDGLGAEAAKNFRDKNRMKRVLREAGLPVARQARVTGADDARAFVEEVGFPIVLKPIDGAGARNTMRVVDEDDLYGALERLLPSEDQPVQAEEFVRGEEHTFETVTIAGQPVWHSSTYYLPGPLHVLENPWMQYCLLLPRERSEPHVEAFRETNRRALQALGMVNGLSHMEWFLTGDGRSLVSEVGARPPGANIMTINGTAHDVDLWQHWARLQVDRVWEVPERKYAVGCAFLRAQGRGTQIARIVGLEAAQEAIGPMVTAAKLPVVGQTRSAHYEGDGWVIVRHPETRGVVDALRRIVTGIVIEAG
ncbi:MAG: ATP-grasp domain-containing protein [Myxococcota bacterium]